MFNLRAQEAIRAKCMHPIGQWEAVKPEEIEQSIVSRFEDIAARYPDRPAVQCDDKCLRYAELNEAANQLGRIILQQLGAGNEPVLFLLATDVLSIVSILGILKTGKCYVALDRTYPTERLVQIAKDSAARLLITDQRHLAQAERLQGLSLTILNLDTLFANAAHVPKHNLGLDIAFDTYAYLVYTSGSTGTPKGVIETHLDVMHFSRVFINAIYICQEDHIALTEPHSFSGAAAKTYPALLSGALLCLFDFSQATTNQLVSWLQAKEVTFWLCVPSVLRQVAQQITPTDTFPALRLIGLGGDRVTRADLELMQHYFLATPVFRVGYGLSEVKQVAFYFWDARAPLSDTLVPVGYCVDETDVLIMGLDRQPMSAGEVGEIVVKTRYMSPGYWRRPDLTERVFSKDPDNPQIRWYWTGDLGMMTPDGCLYHMGRKDQQTKIRGVRIEIAEIEHALWRTGWFKEVVVVVKSDVTGESQLVAYVVANRAPVPSVTELRQHLGLQLPLSMLPSAFVFLDALPLNVNRKVDVSALPAPSQTRPPLGVAYIAPRNEIEHTLCDIWQTVLGISPIGIHDHFLDLGGNSLRASQIVSRIIQHFQVESSPRLLLAQPTIADMALAITQHHAQKLDPQILAHLLDEVERLT